MSQAGNASVGGIVPVIQTLTGDAGGGVGPDGADNISILGGNNITVTGTPLTNTITIDVTDTTQYSLQLGNATGSLSSLGVAGNGEIPIGSVGADPVLANITSTDGTVTITNGAGTIDLSVPCCFQWKVVTGVLKSAVINEGYICNNGSEVTIELPTTAAIGSIIKVTGKGAGGWKISQSVNQWIRWNESVVTTTGVTGSLNGNDDFSSVELLCITADIGWLVLNAKGNISVT